LALLDGIVDIYRPDFKYHLTERGNRYSKVKDYSEKVKLALKEMDRQVGGLKVVNLMDQYYPAHQAFEYPEISLRLSKLEYKDTLEFAQRLGLNLMFP
jgi:putative pyruvate formate lyase activating enzyme